MSSRRKLKRQKSKDLKRDIYQYISNNINSLVISDRIKVLKILVEQLGEGDLIQCSDGCRMVVDLDIKYEALESIIDIML